MAGLAVRVTPVEAIEAADTKVESLESRTSTPRAQRYATEGAAPATAATNGLQPPASVRPKKKPFSLSRRFGSRKTTGTQEQLQKAANRSLRKRFAENARKNASGAHMTIALLLRMHGTVWHRLWIRLLLVILISIGASFSSLYYEFPHQVQDPLSLWAWPSCCHETLPLPLPCPPHTPWPSSTRRATRRSPFRWASSSSSDRILPTRATGRYEHPCVPLHRSCPPSFMRCCRWCAEPSLTCSLRAQARGHMGMLIYGVRGVAMQFSAAVDQSNYNDSPAESIARDEAFVLLTTWIHVRLPRSPYGPARPRACLIDERAPPVVGGCGCFAIRCGHEVAVAAPQVAADAACRPWLCLSTRDDARMGARPHGPCAQGAVISQRCGGMRC